MDQMSFAEINTRTRSEGSGTDTKPTEWTRKYLILQGEPESSRCHLIESGRQDK